MSVVLLSGAAAYVPDKCIACGFQEIEEREAAEDAAAAARALVREAARKVASDARTAKILAAKAKVAAAVKP